MCRSIAAWSLVGFVLTGCSKQTLMQLRLENTTPAGAADVPTKAEVRLVAVTVYHEVAGQLLTAEQVAYVAPECSGGIDCDLPRVKNYLDLALSTGVLSTLVGSQQLAVRPETINRARIYFCKTAGLGISNGRFIAGAMTSPHEFVMGNCSAFARELDPEVTLATDSVATLTLQYDLTGSVTTPGTGPECETSASNLCFRVPTFTPVVAQQRLGLDSEDRDRGGAVPR